jgi:allantoinase
VVFAVEKHASGELFRRVKDTLETFDVELRDQPRVLTLPPHPHLSGVPHRIGYLSKILDVLLARKTTVFMTAGQIAEWYKTVESP